MTSARRVLVGAEPIGEATQEHGPSPRRSRGGDSGATRPYPRRSLGLGSEQIAGRVRRRPIVLAVAVLLLALASCTSSTGPDVVAGVEEGPPASLVVIGGAEADGDGLRDSLRDLWARRVFDELPSSTVYVNLATPGATAADALRTQVPEATALDPTTVLVWLTNGDAARGTPVEQYRTDLAEVVGAFGSPAEVVLLTGWDDPGAAPTDEYATVVSEVAGATDATEVDLTDVDASSSDAQEQVAQRVLEAIDAG